MPSQSDLGSACTSVVTEFHYRRPGQMAAFVVEVEYLSMTEIAKLLHELVWDYRKFYTDAVQALDASDNDEWKEFKQHQDDSKRAWSTLEAAFGHQAQFSEHLVRGDLGHGRPTSDITVQAEMQRITAQLEDWAREIEWPGGAESGSWTTTADDVTEYDEKTRQFMDDKMWPFTKMIR